MFSSSIIRKISSLVILFSLSFRVLSSGHSHIHPGTPQPHTALKITSSPINAFFQRKTMAAIIQTTYYCAFLSGTSPGYDSANLSFSICITNLSSLLSHSSTHNENYREINLLQTLPGGLNRSANGLFSKEFYLMKNYIRTYHGSNLPCILLTNANFIITQEAPTPYLHDILQKIM